MKRIQYSRYGGPEELALADVAPPVPGRGQVLVRVQAASVNPMDWKIRRGEMKMLSGSQFPRGLGHDFAGIVAAVGADAHRFKPGDAVFGVTSIPQAGAFADYLVADEKNVAPKPPGVPFEQAAALTVVGTAAWTGLIDKAKLSAGQSVLIVGCLGGVGRAAVEIALMQGAMVVGTCSAADREAALALGVSDVVDYRAFDVASYRHRFDVIFDTPGALSLRQCGAMLKPHGISLHTVPTPAKMLGTLLSSRHKLVFGNPTPESFAGLASAAEQGRLTIAIGRVVPLSDAIPALIDLETTGAPKGKLIIEMDTPDAD